MQRYFILLVTKWVWLACLFTPLILHSTLKKLVVRSPILAATLSSIMVMSFLSTNMSVIVTLTWWRNVWLVCMIGEGGYFPSSHRFDLTALIFFSFRGQTHEPICSSCLYRDHGRINTRKLLVCCWATNRRTYASCAISTYGMFIYANMDRLRRVLISIRISRPLRKLS